MNPQSKRTAKNEERQEAKSVQHDTCYDYTKYLKLGAYELDTCGACRGTGKYVNRFGALCDCPVCRGTGEL